VGGLQGFSDRANELVPQRIEVDLIS